MLDIIIIVHFVWRYSLPQYRLVSMYGSQMNRTCSSILINESVICNGMSALSDGVIPALSRVSCNTASPWAAQLFTMEAPRGPTRSSNIISFEVDDSNHDRIELAVFNCPLMGISFPVVNVHFDSSFRPERVGGLVHSELH